MTEVESGMCESVVELYDRNTSRWELEVECPWGLGWQRIESGVAWHGIERGVSQWDVLDVVPC